MRFTLVESMHESYYDYIVLILLLMTPIAIILNLFFVLELNIIKMICISLWLLFFLYLLMRVLIDFYKTIKFQKKNSQLFLTYDNNRMASITKKGSFSLDYKEINKLELKRNYLPFNNLKYDVFYVLEVYVEKENIKWFDKLLNRTYKKHEIYIQNENYYNIIDLLSKHKDKNNELY